MMPDKQVYFHEGSSIAVHNNKRIQYEMNDPIGDNGIVYLREADPVIKFKSEASGLLMTIRKAVFRCHCGKEFTNKIQQIKSGKVRSCGCLRVAHCKALHSK